MAKKQTWQQVYDDMQKEDEKEKWWQGFFQKGAFSDGYQFGDLTKTYLGLRADLSQNVISAVFDATENLIDTGAYAVGIFGNKNFKNKIGDFIAKDLFNRDETSKWIYDHIAYDALGVNVWSKYVIGDDVEANSLLNHKADSLVESVAHQVGGRALSMVGVPWQLTTGVNSFGSEAEEAFGKDAGFWEAGISGLITSAAEIGSESLFSGSTIGEKGLFNLDSLTSGIKSKAIKALADWGVDMAAEGAEEMVSNFASSLGQAIYESDNPQEYWEVVKDKNSWDDLMTAFVSGAAMSGGGNFVNLAGSVSNQTDYRTGLTAQEQTVFDSVYESKVKDYVSENGKKPTGNAKKQIFTDTLNELNNGGISIDTIGSVLAPQTQKQYQEVTGKLTDLQQEYEQLYNMKSGDKTDADTARQEALQQEIAELKQQQQDLDDRIASFAKGTRMEESYRERTRKGQQFQADPEQYSSSSASQTVRNIVESGVMNDTRRSHEFVDLLAKISEDTGIVFSTTDAQRLRDTGFAVDGAVVDGYYTENGVAININSPKALESVVGHEVAHALEGTAFAEPLKEAVISYAQSKGEYNSLMDSLTRLYTGKPGYETNFQAKMEKELVADLIGKYLFTDTNFVRNLSVQNRNLFQRLLDEIKYLLRIVKAGSKEAKQLEKIKKLFEEAYRDAKNTAPQDGVKYSITEPFMDSNGKQFNSAVLLDTKFFEGLTPRNWGKKLKEFVYDRAKSDPFIMPVLDENGNMQQIQFADPDDRVTKDSGSNHKVLDKLSISSDNISKLAVVHIDEIIEVSEEGHPYYTSNNDHQWLDQNGWLHRTANVINAQNGNIYELTLDIAKAKDGRHILYATNGKIKRVGNVQVNSLKIRGSGQNSNSKVMLHQDIEKVNPKLSLSKDTKSDQADSKNTHSEDVAVKQDETSLPADVQQQITELESQLQEAVQAGDMEEAANLGKKLYDLKNPEEVAETGENTEAVDQADVSDPV